MSKSFLKLTRAAMRKLPKEQRITSRASLSNG